VSETLFRFFSKSRLFLLEEDFSAKLPRLSLREIFYSFSLFSSSELFFFAFSSLVANSCTSEIPYSYIYFFLVAQKSFSHHAGARKERLRACCFWDVVIHLSSRVGGVFFYEDDRLKFRAIITMEIFNTIRSAVFSLSLSLSICARRVKIAPFESEE
jgi:hypothetical protein